MNAPNACDSVMYLGQHLRGVDRARVILPTEWRSEASPKEFIVIKWPIDKPEYLLVLPPARWELLLKNLEALSLGDEQAAVLERHIGANAFKKQVDTYGRLPLPEAQAKAVGIDNDAMLIGRMNKFEIWQPAKFNETLAKPDMQRIADAIRSIKL
jgi:MraZ protein